jgi:hypothetical protein
VRLKVHYAGSVGFAVLTATLRRAVRLSREGLCASRACVTHHNTRCPVMIDGNHVENPGTYVTRLIAMKIAR